MVVSRLGYLGDHLIHTLIERKYRVVAPGEGEQERLNAPLRNSARLSDGWIQSLHRFGIIQVQPLQ